MCFRDWEDGLKQSKPTIYNEWRINNMSTKKWKNNELMENLSEKFGFKMDLCLLKEEKEKKSEEKEEDSEDQKAKGEIGKKSVEIGADDNEEETKMDHLPDDVLKDIAKKKEKKNESRLRQIIRKVITNELKGK